MNKVPNWRRGRPRTVPRETKRYHLVGLGRFGGGVHYHEWRVVAGPVPALNVKICAGCGLVARWGAV